VLAEWDVIQPEDGGYRMRVEMLRQWIAERKPLSRVRDEMDRILPVAENLFQAAYSIYQGGQLDDAEPLLRQSVRLNPNHIKANQLLAEILLAKGDTDEALKILEILYEYNPSDVKHRLVQVLMNKTKDEKEDKTKILLYTKILKIEPNHSKALAEYKKIYESQGDKAYNNDNLDKALSFYKKAGTSEKIKKVNKKLRIETLYQKALNALERNEREKAQQLLAEVLSTEPSYKEATRYMHLAVTNIDIISLKNKIEELESKLKDKEIQSTESLKKEEIDNVIDNVTADDVQSMNFEEASKKTSKMSIFKGSFKQFFIFGVPGGILLTIANASRIDNAVVIFGISGVLLLLLASYQIFALILDLFFIRAKDGESKSEYLGRLTGTIIRNTINEIRRS